MLRCLAKETILFLEDIGTKPYQWDRMLLHLRYSGRLEGVKGIVFGDMAQCVAERSRSIWSGRFCTRCGTLGADCDWAALRAC